MSREVVIAACAVIVIAIGFSHPAVMRMTGIETVRSHATLSDFDRMPTGSIAHPAARPLPAGVRGLTGLRAAIRAQG